MVITRRHVFRGSRGKEKLINSKAVSTKVKARIRKGIVKELYFWSSNILVELLTISEVHVIRIHIYIVKCEPCTLKTRFSGTLLNVELVPYWRLASYMNLEKGFSFQIHF